VRLKEEGRMLTDCRLTIAGQVDASSVATIVRDVLAGLPAPAGDEEKVLALFRWVREHLFAFVSTMDDAIEPLNKAIQTLNWWGFGLCGRQAKTLGILAAHLLGAENVRLVGMSERERGAWRIGEDGRPYAFIWTPRTRGWKPGAQLGGHTSLEVRWNGRWHFLDAMVGFYRRDREGQIASLQQIIDEPALADKPVGDPLHGDMPYGPEVEIFTKSNVKFYKPGLNAWPGKLPGLNLRAGERLTFLTLPLDGEYFIHPKMRAMFNADVSAGGPREARPNAPAAKYGNAEHFYDVQLDPEASDPHWSAETADWHVPVELPYPITSIHWEMRDAGQAPSAECSGYLHFPPSTGDEIVAIGATGSHRPTPDEPMGLGYRLIVRAGERGRPVRLRLRTIVQDNPLVRPRLLAGRNVVRLAGQGVGTLAARIEYELSGRRQSAELIGAGEHQVIVAGEPANQCVTLMNSR
jgi:hypothetical protein